MNIDFTIGNIENTNPPILVEDFSFEDLSRLLAEGFAVAENVIAEDNLVVDPPILTPIRIELLSTSDSNYIVALEAGIDPIVLAVDCQIDVPRVVVFVQGWFFKRVHGLEIFYCICDEEEDAGPHPLTDFPEITE